jgi:hypothetical protein
MVRARIHLMVALAVASTSLFPRVGLAEDEGRFDPAAAEELFSEAARLMAQERWEEACPMFRASYRFEPARGTLLGIASCHEMAGEVATAWAAFRRLRDEAERAGDRERVAIAEDRIAALEPRLPRLTISTAPGAQPAPTIARNGVEVPGELVGIAIPVDPGEHRIEARARGAKPFEVTVALAEGDSVEVEIPTLARDTAAADEPRATPEVGPEGGIAAPVDPVRAQTSRARYAAYGVIAAGVTTMAVGGAYGWRYVGARADYLELCPDGRCPDESRAEGETLYRRASAAGSRSTVLSLAGLAVAGGGAALWAVSRPAGSRSRSGERASRVAPWIGVGAAGASLVTSF